MRYAVIGRAATIGLALLLLSSICSLSFGAEQVIAAKVVTLMGTVNVTKADGTTEALKDTSKPIVLPATIKMAGPKASFCISLPSAMAGKFNTITWTLRDGEAMRLSVVSTKKGVKLEYLEGTRSFFADVINQENVLVVRALKGITSLIILQNKVNIPEKDAAIITHPVRSFASVIVFQGQVSEIEFSYSPKDEYVRRKPIDPLNIQVRDSSYSAKDENIRFVSVTSVLDTVWISETGKMPLGGSVVEPTGLPPSLRLTIPVPTPETFEQSDFMPL
jgi:hypothetical protein